MQEIISLEKSQLPYFIGIDVGGTNTKIGIVDNSGQTLSYVSIPTIEEEGPAGLVSRAGKSIRQTVSKLGIGMGDLKAAGLGTPGPMDIPKGMILDPTNLPHWRHFPIRDALSKELGMPVAFTNDANAAAYGEYWVGSGEKSESMIMLTLGTGVGGGIIINGVTVEGTNSFGAECGHIIVDSRSDARPCVWGGGHGELEAYASASAVAARARTLLDQGRDSSLAERLKRGEELTTLMLSQEAEQDDALALEVILEAAGYLGIGIVTLVHTIDPGAVILGGAMNFGGRDNRIGHQFLQRVEETFQSRAFEVVAKNTLIDFASLGGDAGYIGAAGIARSSA
ncbi:MAG: ROK family protein [Pirellulaceae bacterium]